MGLSHTLSNRIIGAYRSSIKCSKDTEVRAHFEFSCKTPADQRLGRRGFLQTERRWKLAPLGTGGDLTQRETIRYY